jgi:hypothetical protein
MILTLDTLGERYGLLPSEVLVRASTIDLYVMDAAISYHDYKQKRSQGKYAGGETEQELADMIRRAREQNHG